MGLIPGLDLSMAGLGSKLITFFMGLGIFLVVGVVIWILISWWRNKRIYVTPVRLIRYLENGTKKEMNGLRGGKIQKGGVADFAVKIPKKFRKHNLGYIPDYSKADADGRITFLVIGDGTLWQQLEEKLQTHEEIIYNMTEEEIEQAKINYKTAIDEQFKDKSEKERKKLFNEGIKKWLENNQQKVIKYDLIMKPIPTDVKTVTVNNLQGWRAVLDKQKLTAFGIAIGGFIIMVIAHLISLYIQTKIKCPTG